MEQFPTTIPIWTAVAVLLLLAAIVYGCLLWRLGTKGGKVGTEEFRWPDMFLCAGLMAWFGTAIAMEFGGPEKVVTQKEILTGAARFMSIVAVIWLFMEIRGVRPWRQFGLFRRNPLVCGLAGMGLLISAYPLVGYVEYVTLKLMNGDGRPQSIVKYFLEAMQKSDRHALTQIMVLAVIVAPVAEEIIFRGYIYGVLKKSLGGVVAALLSAGLFAAMHLNLPSLGPLFVLALCLTVAYEAMGSLLVNIVMHALFNLTMLVALLHTPHAPITP